MISIYNNLIRDIFEILIYILYSLLHGGKLAVKFFEARIKEVEKLIDLLD